MPHHRTQKYNDLEDDLTHDHNQKRGKLMMIDDGEDSKRDETNLEVDPRGNASLRDKKKRKIIIMDDEDDNEAGGKKN